MEGVNGVKGSDTNIRRLVRAALLLAVGLVLPFLTAQSPDLGNALLPMHLPVMLCGYLCSGWYGLVVGAILPFLRSLCFGMPAPMYPRTIWMAVELASYRLTCPGVGLEVGASLGQTRNILKGLFYAPHTTAEALKTAHLAAYVFEKLGYEVSPKSGEGRHDIIQTVTFHDPAAMVKYCRGIQFASPVDSYVSPEPWDMPGYDDPVVMAAGAFTGGSSIELSADGPMRDPYTAFMQGGLTYESGRYAIMCAAAYCIS